MPEGPEVETVRLALKMRISDLKIDNVDVIYDKIISNVSKNDFIHNLCGQTIKDVKRKGKWLIFELDDYYLLSHLKMEGKYFIKNKNDEILKHEHIIFHLSNDTTLRYMDTRKFGKMHLIKKAEIDNYEVLTKLGLDPINDTLTTSYLKEKYKKLKTPIKTVLLDQSIIVGIGNIYADEILFLSNIHPLKLASLLNDNELSKIIENTKTVLSNAIKKGGTTIRSYTSVDGITGRFQNDLLVHSREKEKCYNCFCDIIKIRVNGRGTYYCPNCQKEDNNDK